jgi:hypothetical protein
MSTDTDVKQLLDEYQTLVFESRDRDGQLEWEKLQGALSVTGEWTAIGAQHLANLVKDYGAFVLRNAFALALATGVEDGDLGL